MQKEVPPFVGPLAWSGSLLGPVPSVARSSPVQSGRLLGPRSGCSGCSVRSVARSVARSSVRSVARSLVRLLWFARSGRLLGPRSGRSIGPRSGCSGCSVRSVARSVARSSVRSVNRSSVRLLWLLGPVGCSVGCSGRSVRSVNRSSVRLLWLLGPVGCSVGCSVLGPVLGQVGHLVRSVNLLWLLLTSQEHLPVSFSSSSFLLIVFFCLLFISCPAHAYLSPLFSCCSIWYFLDLNYHLTNSWSCILYHL